MRKLHFPRATGISLTVVAVVGSLMVVPATIASAEVPVPSGYDCFPVDKSGIIEGMDLLWIEVKGEGGGPDAIDSWARSQGMAASIQGWYSVKPGDRVSGSAVMVSVNNETVVVAGSGGRPGWFNSSTGWEGNAGGDAGLPGEDASDGLGVGAGLGGGPTGGGLGGVNPDGGAPGTNGNSLQGGWGGSDYNPALGSGGDGGSGYFGGGGGAAATGAFPGGGGGGGSSYVHPDFEVVQAELVSSTTSESGYAVVSVKQCGPRATVDTERVAAIEAAGYQCLAPVAFEYTGRTELFTVPADATVALIDTYGASGGSYSNNGMGLGGMTSAAVAVTPGETLEVNVGGRGLFHVFNWPNEMRLREPISGGFNGGGGIMLPQADGSQGSTGGGGSDVRKAPYTAASRMVVGGGGGGAAGLAGPFIPNDDPLPGGHGGETGGDGIPRQSGDISADVSVIGTGATVAGAGENGVIQGQFIVELGRYVNAREGNEPGEIFGGNFYFNPPEAPYSSRDDGFTVTSGGGGGWFGGGAGGGYRALDNSGRAEGSAGGGSSYAIAGPSGLPATHMESGVRRGDGLVYITTCAKVGGGGTTPVENGPKGPQNIAATGSTAPVAVIWAAAAASLLGTALVLSARRRRSL